MRSHSGGHVANGRMFYQEIVVKVRWEWITAHVVFIVLCLLLLVSTMIATHLSALRGHRCKLSTSAVLQREAKGILTESEMKSFDRERLVCLRHGEGEGWRLLAHDAKQ
jgi:hypothetical protein